MLKLKRNIILYLLIILTTLSLILNLTNKEFLIVKAQHYNAFENENVSKSGFYRIITHDTAFYSDSMGENLLFYLPYTYYVKVISSNGQQLSHVECYGNDFTPLLDGYVETDKLFFDNLTVESPYLNLTITTANACALYSDRNTNDVHQYLFAGRLCQYYGYYTSINGENIFYVSYNNKLGYVKESDVVPFTIPNHKNPLTFIEEEPTLPETELENSATDLTSLRIAIIVCVLFAGLIALIYIIRTKPKKEVAASYYDDNDFE